MKKLIFISFALLAFGTMLSSCKKEGPGPPVEDRSDYLHLVDNGKEYTALRLVKRHQDGFIGAGAPINLTSGYGIAMPDTIGPGTYQLTPTSLVQVSKTENSGDVVYTAQSGTMTITKHDRSTLFIEGTFSGTIAVQGTGQTRTITNGKFRFLYY